MAKDHRAVIQKQGNSFVAAFHEEESDAPHGVVYGLESLSDKGGKKFAGAIS